MAADEASADETAEARLISRASHDLLQPAHALTLFLGIARRSSQDERTLKALARCEQAAGMLTSALTNLTAIATLRGDGVSDACAVKVQDLLNQIAAECTTLRLNVTICASSAVVLADPALLALLARNLVASAAESASGGKVLVGVRRKPNGPCLAITWRGTLGADVHPLLVADALKALNTERTTRNGSDLALLVAGKLSRAMGITIQARSDGAMSSFCAMLTPASDPRA